MTVKLQKTEAHTTRMLCRTACCNCELLKTNRLSRAVVRTPAKGIVESALRVRGIEAAWNVVLHICRHLEIDSLSCWDVVLQSATFCILAWQRPSSSLWLTKQSDRLFPVVSSSSAKSSSKAVPSASPEKRPCITCSCGVSSDGASNISLHH